MDQDNAKDMIAIRETMQWAFTSEGSAINFQLLFPF